MRTTTDTGSFRVRAISIAMGKGATPIKFPLFFIVLFFFFPAAPKNHSLSTLEIVKDLSRITIWLLNKNPNPFRQGIRNNSYVAISQFPQCRNSDNPKGRVLRALPWAPTSKKKPVAAVLLVIVSTSHFSSFQNNYECQRLWFSCSTRQILLMTTFLSLLSVYFLCSSSPF